MDVFMYIHTYTHTHTHTHTNPHTHKPTHPHTHTQTNPHPQTHKHTYIQIYIHVNHHMILPPLSNIWRQGWSLQEWRPSWYFSMTVGYSMITDETFFKWQFFFNLVSDRFVPSRLRHKFNAHERYHSVTSITEKLFVAQHHFSILQKKITPKNVL